MPRKIKAQLSKLLYALAERNVSIQYILRYIFVRNMIKAIDIARSESFATPRGSRTNGLRVIRRFEKVNGIKFDSRDVSHVARVHGMANYEYFFRKIKRLTTNTGFST